MKIFIILKNILVLCLPLIFSQSWAGQPPFSKANSNAILEKQDFKQWVTQIPKLKCRESLLNELEKLSGAPFDSYFEVGSSSFSVRTFRFPATSFQVWVEVSYDRIENSASLKVFEKDKTQDIQFATNCQPISNLSPSMLSAVPKESEVRFSVFNDEKLKSVLDKKESGIIYVWSPKMQYSVTDYNKYKSIAKQLGIGFISVLDSGSDLELSKKSLVEMGISDDINVLNSLELTMRNATLHFPSVFVFGNEKLHPLRVVGVLKVEEIKLVISNLLGTLNSDKI